VPVRPPEVGDTVGRVPAVVVAEVGVIMAVARWAPASNRLLPGLLSTGTVTAAVPR